MLLVAFLFLSTTLSSVAVSAPWVGFEDVPPSNIFFSDIGWLAQEGITRGCDPPANTNFCPTDPVSRGQMAAFLTRALDLPDPAEADWFDDDDGSVFEADIDRLAAAGITAGCNPPANTHFCPEASVTRAQMASFLVRALELEAGVGINWFGDDDSSVHQTNIDRLRAAWITFGCNPPTEDDYCPGKNVTRQQMAAFLHRALTQPQPGAAIGVHGSTWPDPLYWTADMVSTFEVKNVGSVPLFDLSGKAGPFGDCMPDKVTGPSERLGNGDALLDPGEIWDWYCGQPAWEFNGGNHQFEATGRTEDGQTVTATAVVDYTLLHPVAGTVTSSADTVEAGEPVTWSIEITNPSTSRLIRVSINVRENSLGPYQALTRESEVGNGDELLDPDEVWRYTYTATIWQDTFLEVEGGYAADHAPLTGIGLRVAVTPTVKVVEP